MLTQKIFGERFYGGSIAVYVTEPDALLDQKDKVEVNWSCSGSVSIDEAEAFQVAFSKALEFAKAEQKRIEGKAAR